MAKQVYKEETFKLQGGKEITVRPLPVKPLRKFMEEWMKIEKLDKEATELDLVDVMFECAYIVVDALNEDVSRDELEDSLDMKTMEKILSLGGGIQTGEEVDPKLKA